MKLSVRYRYGCDRWTTTSLTPQPRDHPLDTVIHPSPVYCDSFSSPNRFERDKHQESWYDKMKTKLTFWPPLLFLILACLTVMISFIHRDRCWGKKKKSNEQQDENFGWILNLQPIGTKDCESCLWNLQQVRLFGFVLAEKAEECFYSRVWYRYWMATIQTVCKLLQFKSTNAYREPFQYHLVINLTTKGCLSLIRANESTSACSDLVPFSQQSPYN